MQNKVLVVVGGGAAGFFCAINAAAANPQLNVIILEKSNKLLLKVRISGGGRCNVTHACFDIAQLIKKYPRGGNFLKKAFHHFSPKDTIKWFADRGVLLKEEADGRMFPVSNDSSSIVECLVHEANHYGVEILLQQEVQQLIRQGDKWIVSTAVKEFNADYVCIACGGYSRPAMFQWLTAVGHSIEAPVPSLFTFNVKSHPITTLMGVSVPDVQVRIIGSKLVERGPVLITHWGFSGPAILRLSAWGARELSMIQWNFKILINWIPVYNENTLRDFIQQFRFEKATQKMINRNPFNLPQRLWEFLLQESGIDGEIRWADLPSKEQNKLILHCCSHPFDVKGKTTFKDEFVTAGGIKLTEIDPETMMSRLVPNLFFAGEIMDVDGITGGFNFQHAWTSGFLAAKKIAALSASVVI
ncbi:BaiN/RdsA family NAD(P)/FAD-dependent oxidoreductase [Flavihumibacter profundi]|jgi:predicted Rossmann fold flavoprotein|uniref:NAD(P)/FAD-dependent oxidoreductase n=1 Tax=Flavihumibacter profundi TaxID=2716883 RepID=UPI001CC75D0D|nr:NAD(P)/FAD-dependent oxidoreductase [Flavihumibacter profundi]MBZ5855709.1 NAD(P)/FAD-dependent oxidoreductase [Flavihumibacter profundi]